MGDVSFASSRSNAMSATIRVSSSAKTNLLFMMRSNSLSRLCRQPLGLGPRRQAQLYLAAACPTKFPPSVLWCEDGPGSSGGDWARPSCGVRILIRSANLVPAVSARAFAPLVLLPGLVGEPAAVARQVVSLLACAQSMSDRSC